VPDTVELSCPTSPAGDYRQGRNLLVVWRVTTACNLGCRFCGYNSQSGLLRQHTSLAEVLTFGRVLAAYGRLKQQRVRVSWLGGEPFLWRPIHDVSATLAEAGLSLSATTNGTALGATNVVATLRAHFDLLHVSVDGVGAAHDRSRRKTHLYAKVLRDISRLVSGSQGPRVGVNLLLTAESIFDIETLCRQLGDAGVTFLSFNPLIASPDAPEASRKLSVQHLPMLDDIESGRASLSKRTGVTVLGSASYFERIRSYVRGKSIAVGVSTCQPGQSRLLIDEHSSVRPCAFVEGLPERVLVSEIKSVEDLFALRGRFAIGIRTAQPAPCRDCMDPFIFGKFEVAA
jgi:MoaA/NifB/PqqE/SkfB family radical SAM enzyme